MTGGVVVVLGPTGRNFAAGMSGGIALVLDETGTFAGRCNTDTVSLEVPTDEDAEVLWRLLVCHREHTASAVAARVLAAWPASAELFVKVMPHDLKRVLGRDDRFVGAAHA
jgi:glutamate synthase (ferredoxin)